MKLIALQYLSAGMVTAEPVRSKTGQVIVKENVSLTNRMINHLNYYGIKDAAVITAADSLISQKIPENPHIIQYQKGIRESIEFKHFEKKFNEKVDLLKQYMNDVIVRNKPLVESDLLAEIVDLFNSIASTVNIFDMLHCIRKINDSTYAHSINVAIICRMMGIWLHLPSNDIDVLTLAGLLHDIGKCEIPKAIIGKPSKLTDTEYEIIKQHSLISYHLLKNHPMDSRIRRAALMHHERCDGSGYPLGLVADDIDDFAIIVSIADVYDAMTTNRCYREALCPFEVIATLEREGFRKYKPQYIVTFLEHVVDTYMNNRVMLNDGSFGKIVLKNRTNLARPTVYSEDSRFINLSKHPDLFIQAIV